MPMFCIPKHLVEKLKKSAIKGEVDIKKLYEMSSIERKDFFKKFTNEELGKFINTKFEEAMVSKQKTAFTDWAKSVFSPESKTKPVFKNVIDKINNLDELGVLNPKSQKAFLEDLVSDKLGVSVSPEEVRIISEKAKVINEAQVKLGDNLGVPSKESDNLEFFKSLKEMEDYLRGLSPASNLKILTGTIGRGMMLASVKSPVLNIGSNLEVGLTEALSRRLANGQIKGANNKLAVDYIKMVNKIYKDTGYDLSRMTTLADSGISGERVLGETVHSQGKGAVRKVGRVVEDIVFKNLMGVPDVASASTHFADSVNLNSLKIAKGDKIKASEIMEDAMRIEPLTPEGELLRGQGILDAEVATWTNNSWASKITQGLRKIFNEATGDARVGDILFPFIKTPANVIATGIDYAGAGIPKSLFKLYKAFSSKQLGEKIVLQDIIRDTVRGGLGLTGAVIITSQLKDDDFVGAYDPARAQIEQLRDSNTNSLRIGNKWISTDWLGPLSVPVTAMMYARKYGKNGLGEKVFQYAKGTVSSVLNLPVISDIYDYIRSVAFKKNQSLSEMASQTVDYISSQAYSRLVPSLLSDIAKATDVYERTSGKGVQGIKAKIPGKRETLPVKTNVFGEPLKTEGFFSTMLFGSRIKTDTETEFIKELSRVQNETSKSISFTDFDKSNSAKISQFKEKIGGKIGEAKEKYQSYLKSDLEKLLSSNKYKNESDEEKLKDINAIDLNAIEKVYSNYRFKYKK